MCSSCIILNLQCVCERQRVRAFMNMCKIIFACASYVHMYGFCKRSAVSCVLFSGVCADHMAASDDIHMHTHTNVSNMMWTQFCVYINNFRVHAYTYMYKRRHIPAHRLQLRVSHMYVCMYVCMYVYTYMHIHTHTSWDLQHLCLYTGGWNAQEASEAGSTCMPRHIPMTVHRRVRIMEPRRLKTWRN
jgi:hypothetical protein